MTHDEALTVLAILKAAYSHTPRHDCWRCHNMKRFCHSKL